MRRRPGCGLEQHFCKIILEQYSFIYFGHVKEKYIELLYEKKNDPRKLGRHMEGMVVSHNTLLSP